MQIGEGQGWRLLLAPERQPYSALIGGADWAVELDGDELSCLRRGVLALIRQREQLLQMLMPEEELDLELDLSLPDANGGGSLFVALSGTAAQWSLRFVLTPADGSRAAEGGWAPGASEALAAALAGLGAADTGSSGVPPSAG